MSQNFIRVILFAAGLTYAVLTFGFTMRQGWAIDLWPWPDTPLSYIFIGSISGALAAGALWSALSGHLAAVAGSLAGLVVIYGSIGAYLGVQTIWGQGSYSAHALVAGATGTASVLLLIAVLRISERRNTAVALEPLVRTSTGIFALALSLAGAALVMHRQTVFPWPLSPASSTVFGLIFLGLALVYAQVCVSGSRAAAVVAMAGFLVYDLILLPPFIGHFARVTPERMLSLTLYTSVLVYSAALAIWFLVWRRAIWLKSA